MTSVTFWLAADVETKYLLNFFLYQGKDGTRPAGDTFLRLVLRLVEPYMGKGRNVTMDNFFTSIPLADKLIAKKTSLLGTMDRGGSCPPLRKTTYQQCCTPQE
jgi:hypothetical protein